MTTEQASTLRVLTIEGFGRNAAAYRTWRDRDGLLEEHLTEIVVAIVVAGEERFRHGEIQSYEHELAYQRRWHEARLEREAEQQEAMREKLLGDAIGYRHAADIRALVTAAQTLRVGRSGPTKVSIQRWSVWALSAADIIDPLVGLKFLHYPTVGEFGEHGTTSW